MIATLFLVAAAGTMTFTADRIAADNVTKAMTATGHVHATYNAMTLRGECITKDADGRMIFHSPTCVTTCSNEVGHTHWNITGELEYKENDHVLLRNAWIRFYEIPVIWLPYLYYPLDTDCGFSWMPGYVGRWGGFLLTKYTYHIIGDVAHEDNTWWLKGDTRFDLRYQQGVAVGEDLDWNLGDFGAGSFLAYYAWDQNVDGNGGGYGGWNSSNYGSDIEENRYIFSFKHRWDITERDALNLRGSFYSDSYVRSDFQRKTMFDLKSQWFGYTNSGAFWDHLEDDFAFGGEVSGRLNKFYSMVGRLPEFYLDVNPQPIYDLPINYESSSRFGYLSRKPAEYGSGASADYSRNPGVWADYDSFRIDTYHRLTAPFRTMDDMLSVVPRVGYHGTYWSQSGDYDLTGARTAAETGGNFRSIAEGGVTFAGRGTASVGDSWRHMMEPYLDVLMQKSWLANGSSRRPYMFDSIDGSYTWEDQFAGRSRNLPYSYYGITPGYRNAWSAMDDNGTMRQIVDFDCYVAAQFNSADYVTGSADYDARRLAEVDSPNYGKNGSIFVPGARLRWSPEEDIYLGVRGEYDSDNNKIAYGAVSFSHKLNEKFKYNVRYDLRDHRYWDYSSFSKEEFNFARMHMVNVDFEYQVFDWLACGPHIRWDLRSNELDAVGAWIDYLTDCIGYRVILEYDNEFTMMDGYKYESDFSVGFYIYLRCFGPSSGSIFTGQ